MLARIINKKCPMNKTKITNLLRELLLVLNFVLTSKRQTMKKQVLIIILCIGGLIGGMTNLEAQSYKSAIGIRLGVPLSLSFKTFISETHAIELFASFQSQDLGFGLDWKRISLGGSYQLHNEIPGVDGLNWYYGGGALVSFWSYSEENFFADESSVSLGLQGNIGLDYKFESIPLNLSVDWIPTIFINGYLGGFGAGYGALAARYTFGGG